MSIVVRSVNGADVASLESAFDLRGYFAKRREAVLEGHCVLLAAWSQSRPVAHGYLWDGAEPESPQHLSASDVVRRYLAGVPLIQSLYVAPDHRRCGIGRAMVVALEREARERGHASVALGVGPDNHGAGELYRGMGYRRWDHGLVEYTYYGMSEDGERQRFTETSVMMQKAL